MRFDENPFICQSEKEKKKKRENKKIKGFKFRSIIGRVQVTSWQSRG